MNILFLIKDYSVIGGIQTVTKHLIRYFLDKNCCLFVISNFIEDNDIDNVTYVELPDKSDFSTDINKKFVEDFSVSYNIDFILNQGVFFYKEIEVPNHIKTIAILHSTPYWELHTLKEKILHPQKLSIKAIIKKIFYPYFAYRNKYIIKKLYRNRINNHTVYVSLDKNYTNILIKDFPDLKDKFLDIHNPLTYKHYKNNKNHYKKEDIILYVGSLTNSVKRVDKLLYIWNCIHTDWKLIIIGDGKDKDNLIKLKNKLNLNNVEFVGYQNPKEYYEKAKILCLTSEFEGLPMVTIESQFYGCVPIVNDCCDALKNILPKKYLIVKRNNTTEFANKLNDLILDTNKLELYSRECIENSHKFDIEIIGEKWLELFKSLQ